MNGKNQGHCDAFIIATIEHNLQSQSVENHIALRVTSV